MKCEMHLYDYRAKCIMNIITHRPHAEMAAARSAFSWEKSSLLIKFHHSMRSFWSLNMESCHDANFVVTDGTPEVFNLRCRHWRQSWHHDNFRFSVMRNSIVSDLGLASKTPKMTHFPKYICDNRLQTLFMGIILRNVNKALFHNHRHVLIKAQNVASVQC